MAEFNDLQRRTFNIETIEKRGDRITHDTIDLLHKTFITPIDRDSIHRLITRMDDILDLSEDVAQSIVLYDVKESTVEAHKLACLCVACCEEVEKATVLLKNMGNAESDPRRSAPRSTSSSRKPTTSCARRLRVFSERRTT